MCLKKCNSRRMYGRRMGILSVLTLVMFMIWRQLSTYGEPGLHLKKSTSDFHDTPQSVEKQTAKVIIKEFMARNVRRPCTVPSATGTLNETTTRESGQHRRFNRSEVLNMRQHILKFYNPETNLTLTKSSLHIGQRLKYELNSKNSFSVTQDFLKLILKESPLKDRHFSTCAVVGNSGILLNSSCGKEIDSKDFVMRCNLPPTEGYEKDVGSKANVTTMNPSVIFRNFGQWHNNKTKDYDRLLRRLKLVGDQILFVPALTAPLEKYVKVIMQVVLQHKLPIKTAFPPAGINPLVRSIWTDAGIEILRPTTGIHMYTLAATVCDQIHLYGFYPFTEDTRARALSYHYYDTKKMITNSTHNMPAEFRAFQQLHLQGAVELHTEPCH